MASHQSPLSPSRQSPSFSPSNRPNSHSHCPPSVFYHRPPPLAAKCSLRCSNLKKVAKGKSSLYALIFTQFWMYFVWDVDLDEGVAQFVSKFAEPGDPEYNMPV
ncbi:hypothetical protein ACFX2I_040313 [Malus domestica]